MSYYSHTEYYDLHGNDFYGEIEINPSSDSGSSSGTGAWDDYQNEYPSCADIVSAYSQNQR